MIDGAGEPLFVIPPRGNKHHSPDSLVTDHHLLTTQCHLLGMVICKGEERGKERRVGELQVGTNIILLIVLLPIAISSPRNVIC